MKKIKQIMLYTLLLLSPSLLFATTPPVKLAKIYILDGDIQKEYNHLVEVELKKVGFNMADPHHRVNDQYKEKYGSTVLDVLSFLPAVNDDLVMPLFNIDPRLAGFSPFNMLIYKKLSDKVTHVGHLEPEAMLDILGISDPEVRQKFIASFPPLDTLIEKYFKKNGLKYKVEEIPYKNVTKKKMINFQYTFERPEELDDFIEAFQNKFELAFIGKNYLIAGFHNFLDTDNGEEILKGFDAFWSYSLCHLSYSYNIFDNKGARPDAGLYAPCTMYAYIKKDSHTLVIGMPALANVKNTLNIHDKERIKWMDKLDKEIPEILTSMGMVAVENVNPLKETPKPLTLPAIKTKEKKKSADSKQKKEKQRIKSGGETIDIVIPQPPKVPVPVQVKTTNSRETQIRSIKFSKRVPNNYIPIEERMHQKKPTNTAVNVGGINNEKISTYMRGKLMDVKTAVKALKDAGFTTLSVSPLDKKKQLISIVFTDKTLTAMGSKKGAAFMASLRLLINKKENHISITNPLYMAKAFMLKHYDEKGAKATLKKITSHFKGLVNSKDMLKFQLLPKYQFMHGMPQYQDMVTVAKGSHLLADLKNNKQIVFTQKLDNGATLIGVKLGRRASRFTSLIGTNNAALLPYPIVIENGKAKILDPKYYISVMYPLLQMSEFMTIASVPGAIIKDCGRIFQ